MSENHVLHVRADPAFPDDPQEYTYSITCPHGPDDMTRQCILWWECITHSAAEVADLLDDGAEEAPCSEAHPDRPWHRVIDGRVCHPSRECFPAQGDCLPDAAHDLGLAPGDYPVDYDVEDFSDFTLHVIRDASARSAS